MNNLPPTVYKINRIFQKIRFFECFVKNIEHFKYVTLLSNN